MSKVKKVIFRFLRYIDLRSEVEDFESIHIEIEKGIVFKGTNLWVLAFAIVVASVGLNINSTAVIIGAMLISPLMGPINGMGYGLATYDIAIFKRAIKNYTFAVLAGLIASTLYFLITPLNTAHSELLARTSPTIYDVLIALFGGLAGMVAISSKLKGNVIPGVAIATALMPPLCTAGFGLATGQYNYFFGAIYLFTINTVFIAISSVLVSKVLKFPIRKDIEQVKRKRLNQYISLVIVITLLPSIYFGYVMVQNEKFANSAALYVKNVTVFEGNYLLKSEVDPSQKTIRLIYGGNTLTDDNKTNIRNRADLFGLKGLTLIFDQGFSLNEESLNEVEVLNGQIGILTNSLEIEKLKTDSILNTPCMGKQILAEIRPIYPEIKECSFSETMIYTEVDSVMRKTLLVVFAIPPRSLKEDEKEKIIQWMQSRLKPQNVQTYFVEKKWPVAK